MSVDDASRRGDRTSRRFTYRDLDIVIDPAETYGGNGAIPCWNVVVLTTGRNAMFAAANSETPDDVANRVMQWVDLGMPVRRSGA